MRIGFVVREHDLLARCGRIIFSAALLLTVGGCAAGSYMPQSGPSRADLVNKAQLRVQPAGPEQELQYALIPLNQASVALLGTDETPANFPADPTDQRSADGLIGVADQVSVTVFESGS